MQSQDPLSYGSKNSPSPSSPTPLYAQSTSPQYAQEKFDFNNGVKYHDLWATVLYLFNFAVFIYVGSFGVSLLDDTPSNAQGQPASDGMNEKTKGVFISTIVWLTLLGAVLAALYLTGMRKYPKQFIKATYFGSVGLTFFIALISFVCGAVIQGVVYMLFGGLYLLFYYFWRHHIDFTASLLETVIEIGDKYPASYFLAVVSLFVSTLYQLWWASAVRGLYIRYQEYQPNTLQMFLLYMVFSFYWTIEIIRNVLHVTVSGTVASYYFLAGTAAMPQSPTVSAAKRAVTSSFGPIAFGSLIVAAIQTLRALVRSATRERSLVAAIAQCILACIEGIARAVTYYAFIQVAMYGKSFMTAARDTMDLLTSTGFSVIISDNFVNTVIGMGAFLNGLILAGLSFISISTQLSEVEYMVYNSVIMVTVFLMFFIGFSMIAIIGMYVHSAVSTLYICLAEDPQALARTKPEMYQKFKSKYPEVSWRI